MHRGGGGEQPTAASNHLNDSRVMDILSGGHSRLVKLFHLLQLHCEKIIEIYLWKNEPVIMAVKGQVGNTIVIIAVPTFAVLKQ